MGYYDDEKNVAQYIRLAADYDGRLLIDALKTMLPKGSKLLELGMGPGKDLLLLNEDYDVIGSDSSQVFIERFRRLHPSIRVMPLDAITMDAMDAAERFDGIYSNKTLCHLTADQLRDSFEGQARALRKGGIALHSFWHGRGESCHHGLRFVYYCESSLEALIGAGFETLKLQRYTEMSPDDSLYIALRKR